MVDITKVPIVTRARVNCIFDSILSFVVLRTSSERFISIKLDSR
jgi:hypothetical protein